MDIVDRDIERAETEASREFYARHPTAQAITGASLSQTSTSSSIDDRAYATRTQSLHAKEIERIETGRLTHSHTVGASDTRTTSRKSVKDLPDFGDGKPYPPSLPERGEYVVGFAGKDDPLHPQNWVLSKK